MRKKSLRLIAGAIFFFILTTPAHAAQTLIPVGKVVGIELHDDSVFVAAFEPTSAAQAAGVQKGDRLVSIDGQHITSTQDVQNALDKSDGTVQVTLRRGDELTTLRVEPQITPQGPKLGIYLRQGVSGIGTVTYFDPDSKNFAALGHGVNDASGQLLAMRTGKVYSARVVSVRKGTAGEPGQLMGTVSGREAIGTLSRNTAQGIFGKGVIRASQQPLPVGTAEDVKTGNATILSTVSGDTPQEYSVEIIKIYPASRQNGRNMLIRITDPALLETTGGIVQGMSGSPIIQDGILVGAVTHVLVNDPTTGYGIFIENMLEVAG